MIDVLNKKCLEENCHKIPNFNLPNETVGIYCKIHSKENMINIISKKCLGKNCDTIVNKKYKGYCLRCFIYKFPDVKISRNYKVIKDQFKNQTMTFDKQTGGCSKRRSDV